MIRLPPGVKIKTLQSGVATLLAGTTSVDIAITAVGSLAKTIAFQTSSGGDISALTCVTAAWLTSASNLRVAIGSSTGNDLAITWFVIEFDGPISVQSGVASLSNTTLNITLTAVDLTKTFVYSTFCTPTNNAKYIARATLTTTTNLQLTRTAANDGITTTVGWFVVSFTG